MGVSEGCLGSAKDGAAMRADGETEGGGDRDKVGTKDGDAMGDGFVVGRGDTAIGLSEGCTGWAMDGTAVRADGETEGSGDGESVGTEDGDAMGFSEGCTG